VSLDALESLAAAPVPSAPAIGGSLATELAQLKPVAPRKPLRQLATLLVASVVYAAAILLVQRTRVDLEELPVAWLVAVGAAWLAGFVIPCTLALVPGRAMLPRWHAAAWSAVAASVLLPAIGLALHPSGPSSGSLGWGHIAEGGGCLAWGLVVACVPIIIGARLLRGALPTRSRWTCAALGAGAGSMGGLVLHLHCPIADPAHIGLVHGGLVVVAAALAAVFAPWITDKAWRHVS
jgi:hypothetical protein